MKVQLKLNRNHFLFLVTRAQPKPHQSHSPANPLSPIFRLALLSLTVLLIVLIVAGSSPNVPLYDQSLDTVFNNLATNAQSNLTHLGLYTPQPIYYFYPPGPTQRSAHEIILANLPTQYTYSFQIIPSY